MKGTSSAQKGLFSESEPAQESKVPEGFRYRDGVLSEAEETALATALRTLDLKPFEFHGHLGNRRVASFGFRYDYSRGAIEEAKDPPAFLSDLRVKVAKFAGRAIDEFQQIGVNEYSPGAGIGWHRDKAQFGVIVGLSLLAPAKMRFRRAIGDRWMRMSKILQPRSIYILEGEARTLWEHSIPPLDVLRYSLTFRTLADAFDRSE